MTRFGPMNMTERRKTLRYGAYACVTLAALIAATFPIAFQAATSAWTGKDGPVAQEAAGTVAPSAPLDTDVTASRFFWYFKYATPGIEDVSVTIANPGAPLTSLTLIESVPVGWTFDSIVSQAPPQNPPVVTPPPGDPGPLTFSWVSASMPTLPVTLKYRLNVPAGQSGDKMFSGQVLYSRGGSQFTAPVGPLNLVAQRVYHSSDYNSADHRIALTELLRLIQFYNSTGYHVEGGKGVDGYAPGAGSHDGAPHDSDFNPQNWQIGLPELLRLIQFYNSPGYHVQEGTSDGYAAGVVPSVTSFSINNGAATTNSRTVTLNNVCAGGPTQYMASESPTFAGAAWMPYATAPSFVLSQDNGMKTVYLKVRNAVGESARVQDTITLQAGEHPVAGFTANPTSGVVPLLVTFTDTSTGEITSRTWTFGDGGTSGQVNPSHTYSSAGMFTVSLTVTGPGGSDTLTRDNLISVSNPGPVAGFNAAPTTGEAPLTVNFTDASTGDITSRTWSFGDGGTRTEVNPSHTYASAGVYTVSLIVSGPGGSNTLTREHLITVNNPPPPTLTGFDPMSGTVGTAVTIQGNNFITATGYTVVKFNGVPATVAGITGTTINVAVPVGATTGPVSVTTPGGTATSAQLFTVVLSRDFSLSVAPAQGTAMQGGSTTFRVSATGANGFSDLITLSVSDLASGLTGSFSPATITAGRSATLTIHVGTGAGVGSVPISVDGTAQIDGSLVSHSTTGSLDIIAAGPTALVGRVLDTDEQPIQNVEIRVGDQAASTDENGNFILQNPAVGEQVVLVDGGPANTADVHYPTIPVSMTIIPGQINELPYVPHLHLQKGFNFTEILPDRETIATDPELPGVALRIPAGTDIIGWDGNRNEIVSIRTVPVGSLPVKPPPPEVSAKTVYMFYFGKQGGGIPERPIPFVAPNDLGLNPGEKADLWYFDESPNIGEAPNDWRTAGAGTVSQDGRTIVTDPGVGIPKFCCGAALWNPRRGSGQQGGATPQQGQGASGGDPVDLSTGIFMLTATDMVLPGRIPFALSRVYRSGDPAPGPFGIGTTMVLDDYLERTSSEVVTYVYRGNARTQFFRQPDGSYVNTTIPAFRGARITINSDGTQTLRYKDGSAVVFDSGGRPVKLRDRNANELVIKREVEYNPSTIIEPSGRILDIDWVILARDRVTMVTDPIGRTVRYGYDGQNRLTTVTDPNGGVTRYTYDAENRMTSITDARGITFLQNTYDANSRVCQQVQADAGTWTFYYITSDTATLPESVQILEEAAAGGPITMTPCSAQPSNGIVVATVLVDPNGHPTTYRFNGSGYVISVTDALGQTTVMEREDGTNMLLSTTDAMGRTTHFTYDDFGNVTSISDPEGNVRTFEYEPTFNKLAKITDPLGNFTTLAYDSQGNLVSTTDQLGNVTHIAYDEFGQPVSITDALGNVTTSTYDSHGNLTAISDPLGNTSLRSYDLVSRLVSQTDPRGRTTRFDYDFIGRISQITDALTGLTRFDYDENGNLLAVTDARGNSNTYTYDLMDRVASRTDPVGVAESFGYDAAGNQIRHTDQKGQTTNTMFDALGRPVEAAYADATSSDFVYDSVGRLVQTLDSAIGAILNEYDDLDRLLSQTTTLGTIQYQYDSLGRRTQMNVPGQNPVTYTYDDASRLTRITQGSQVVDITYDDLGRRISLTLPNNVSTEYSYDTASRLVELVYRNGVSVLGNLAYQYDSAGNRIAVGGTFARTLLPAPVSVATYDAANRQSQFGDKQMAFDANGSLTSVTASTGVSTFSWDSRNRLVGVDDNSIETTFEYDALGRRSRMIQRNTGSDYWFISNTQYLYDGFDIVRERFLEPVNLLRTLAVDELLVYNDDEYVLADALGSAVALSNSGGVLTTQYGYEPFGRTSISGASTNSFQYAGRENDATGIYYYRARYYSPVLHRFLSEDPLGMTGGLNLYSYVGNNPIDFIDPLGLWRWPDYISLNINVAIPTPWTGTFFGWSGQAALDRYGNLYWAPFGATGGKSLTFASGSFTAGWLNKRGKPSADKMRDFLSANSWNVGGGYYVGAGETLTPGVGTATEVGFFSPQFGVSYHYSWQKGNLGIRW